VCFGSVAALVCMTVLSTLMGLILSSILPKSYTHIISGILFFYFGIKLMYNSRSMENKVSDELGEVEEELLSISRRRILLMIVVVVRGGWWGVDRHQACCRGI